MKKKFKLDQPFLISAFVSTGLLAGCASSNVKKEVLSPEQIYSQRISEAESLLAAGNRDAAALAYEKIALDNPAKGEPWSKVAQIQFAQGHYSQAIVAAEETLRRDPSNRAAKSVTAVGGLRLAVRSLEELRNDTELAGDTKTDAERLAVMLRETLGEPVLEPVKKAPPPVRRSSASRNSSVPKAAQRTPAVSTPSTAPPATPVTPKSGGGGDPFGSLK